MWTQKKLDVFDFYFIKFSRSICSRFTPVLHVVVAHTRHKSDIARKPVLAGVCNVYATYALHVARRLSVIKYKEPT